MSTERVVSIKAYKSEKGKMSLVKNVWEDYLVDFCSPTLAGIKCANLFGISYTCEKTFNRELQRVNRMCNPKGINIITLQKKNNRALVYVYRENMVKKILCNADIKGFLATYGYTDFDVRQALAKLSQHMCNIESFPHEIGIFLGYPFCDVKGFIENKGEKCLFCGHWKVYENEHESRKLFYTFDTCKECFINRYLNGETVIELMAVV